MTSQKKGTSQLAAMKDWWAKDWCEYILKKEEKPSGKEVCYLGPYKQDCHIQSNAIDHLAHAEEKPEQKEKHKFLVRFNNNTVCAFGHIFRSLFVALSELSKQTSTLDTIFRNVEDIKNSTSTNNQNTNPTQGGIDYSERFAKIDDALATLTKYLKEG